MSSAKVHVRGSSHKSAQIPTLYVVYEKLTTTYFEEKTEKKNNLTMHL